MRSAAPASGFPVSTVIFLYELTAPQAGYVRSLNSAPVYMARPVEADFLAFIYLYDPTILDNQGYCSETD